MKLESLKDLEKLMIICRKRGIAAIEIDGIKFTLNDSVPTPAPKATHKPATDIEAYLQGQIGPDVKIPTDGPTPEQLLFGSADPAVWDT